MNQLISVISYLFNYKEYFLHNSIIKWMIIALNFYLLFIFDDKKLIKNVVNGTLISITNLLQNVLRGSLKYRKY